MQSPHVLEKGRFPVRSELAENSWIIHGMCQRGIEVFAQHIA